MKSVTYFAGARSGTIPAYEKAAYDVGYHLGQKKCLAKFGGSRNGLMGGFCRGFLAAEKETHSSAKIIGITPEKYLRVNQPETLGIEFTVTDSLTERKKLLLEGVDGFLVLPGGTGTLDEIYECIEQDYLPVDRDPRYTEYNIRPIYVLNMNGFYDHTLLQLEHMVKEGFLIREKMAALHFYSTIEEYIAALDRFFTQ